MESLSDTLKRHEKLSLSAYPDRYSPLGEQCVRAKIPLHRYDELPNWRQFSGRPWTAGYGHTGPDVYPGLVITKEQADVWLAEDIEKAESGASSFLWFHALPLVRQNIVVNMIFNMGLANFRGFRRMIAAIERHDFEEASNQMKQSVWAGQVGARASELAQLMRDGDVVH
jgi:lysozyme